MAQWLDEEIALLKKLYEEKHSLINMASELGRTTKSVRLYLNRKLDLKLSENIERKEIILCLNCQCSFESNIYEKRRFCTSSCAAIYNNKLKPKRVKKEKPVRTPNIRVRPKVKYGQPCVDCSIILSTPNAVRCSKCDVENKWFRKGILIKDGLLSHISAKSYLIHLHGASCMDCGWNKVNPHTGKVPIELEHIDGNSENNKLNNLKLICPNCHSLTATYKGANAGNGRAYRRERYAAGKSY